MHRSRRCQDAAGKRLIFVVVNGTDRTLLWKGTVRIGCAKVDTLTNRIETHRIINLVQFVRVLRTFRAHVAALESSEEAESMRVRSGLEMTRLLRCPPHAVCYNYYNYFF